MTRDYKSISDEELLNYEDAQTAIMDRYRRIMQHRNNEVMLQVAKQLQGVSETVYRASQLADARGTQAIAKVDDFIGKVDEAMSKADDAIQRADSAAREQKRQQKVMKALTVVLAVSTVVYTIINGFTAYEAYQANKIQRELLDHSRSTP